MSHKFWNEISTVKTACLVSVVSDWPIVIASYVTGRSRSFQFNTRVSSLFAPLKCYVSRSDGD